MKKSNKPKSLAAVIAAVAVVLISSVLYGQGIISEELYLKLISASGVSVSETYPAEVHFIDVGQADCILIKTDEKTVLIDAGDIGGENEIINYLHTNGVSSIDVFITTHPHADHIGSASEIIEAFPVATVIMPEIPEKRLPTTRLFENLLITLSESDCEVLYAEKDMVFDLGSASLEILGPTEYTGTNLNNYSVVSKLTCGSISFLFTGDAEEEIELELIEAGEDLSCTVFNAGHHGSSTSNSVAFIKAASPEYAAISCGKDNDYGHPHKETISLFKEFGIEYYRTDYSGDIVFTTDGTNVYITTER